MGKRGRPPGTVKTKIPTAVINEWATVYNEGGDTGKALVLDRIDSLGLEKDVILERMSVAYYKKRSPELAKIVEAEVGQLLHNVNELIHSNKDFKRLSEILPRDNLIINLETLEIQRVKRPVPRTKVKNDNRRNTKNKR